MYQGSNTAALDICSNLRSEMNPQLINAWLEKHLTENALTEEKEDKSPNGRTMICMAQWG